MNNLLDKESIKSALEWRYAVKTFDAEKKISAEQWAVLEKSLIFAPSSYGLQPYKFIVLTEKEKKEELVSCAFGQRQVADCSHLVAILAKKTLSFADIERYIERTVEVRGTPRENLSDYEKSLKNFAERAAADGSLLEWSKRQTYIVLGFLMETAALIGVDSCPMEGFSAVEADRVLGLTETDFTTAVLCPIGFRSANDWLSKLAKVRLPKAELFIETLAK